MKHLDEVNDGLNRFIFQHGEVIYPAIMVACVCVALALTAGLIADLRRNGWR